LLLAEEGEAHGEEEIVVLGLAPRRHLSLPLRQSNRMFRLQRGGRCSPESRDVEGEKSLGFDVNTALK